MLHWIKRRTEVRRTAEKIYGDVVTAARRADFYSRLGVQDTPEGRFELVALHLFIVLEAIQGKGSGAAAITQRTIETFVTDMDDCMREMGVGDLTVPKKVKRAAAAFYERAGCYRQALKTGDASALETSFDKYIFKGNAGDGVARILATFVRNASSQMSARSLDTLAGDGDLLSVLDHCWKAAA